MPEISGQAAENLLHEQIAAHHGGILRALAPLDAQSAVSAWLDTIRAIEEFINLPLFGLDDDALEQAIVALRLDAINPGAFAQIGGALTSRFGSNVARRFTMTLMQAAAIGAAFRQHGLLEAAAGFQTVGHAISYFQSRRRHLVTLLYTMPAACKGSQPVQRMDTLNLFMPLVEVNGITLTGLHQQLMLAKVFPDFKLFADQQGFSANHRFEPLDVSFLEPERASIVDMQAAISPELAETFEAVDPRLIFSAAELRNGVRLLEAAYAEFDLTSSAFAPVAALIPDFLAHCRDDYFIEVPAARFDGITDKALTSATKRLLVHRGGDYVHNTNAFAPFVEVGGIYMSSVTLLSRFLYYWKNVCLNHIRRFQIRSGFIFEENVKASLALQGFTVTEIKRINRKEFDVVAVLGPVIYNLQCKNNLVDLSHIETDAPRFARYNRQLDRYYASALAKEQAREQLLKDKLGLSEVKHLVVSRFPVATGNPRVIPYSRLGQLKAIVLGP